MLRFTLDTNCVIDLEERCAATEHLAALRDLARAGQIKLAVPAIMALERGREGVIAKTFRAFEQRLTDNGLGEAEILLPISYSDVTFWDRGYWAELEVTHLEPRIHTILFPEVPFMWIDFVGKEGLQRDPPGKRTRWLNAKCDVLSLWSHIHHRCDVFVTSDRNFLKAAKAPQLIALGAGMVLSPRRAVTHALTCQGAEP